MMVDFGWIVTEVLGVTILALIGAYMYCKYVLYNFWRKRGVPYVEPTVPTGNIAALVVGKATIGDFFSDAYRDNKHHRFFGMYTLLKPNLIIADPDLIRLVLAKEFASFHDRGVYCNEKVDPLSGHLFLLPGKKWRNLRVKLTPTFTSGKIKHMFETLKQCGDQLTNFLEGKARRKECIEIKDIFARFSTDIIMSVAFGINCNSLANPDCEFRRWGKKVFEPRPFWNSLVLFAPKIMDFFQIALTDYGVRKFFIKAFTETVEFRKSNNIVRRDFMDLIIQLMDRGYVDADDDKEIVDSTNTTQNKLSFLEGAAQAYVFYLAGFETSSTTVTNCLYELALNPEIQEKTRSEIDAALEKHGGLTFNCLSDMPYLHNVINETMRKYPALPILNRVSTKDVDLEGVLIPEGTLVTIPVYGIHKDPVYYPDPEKFDPNRFSDENVAARHPYTYLPFGEGPRICIGMRFGLVQTKVAIISALSKFRFKMSPDTPLRLSFDVGSIILSPKEGLPLIIERR